MKAEGRMRTEQRKSIRDESSSFLPSAFCLLPFRFLSDDHLLSVCRMDLYRGSGPGGQKRNKTSNAVRLTHLPSGLHVTATESRSLALNKLHALRRLRIKLATELREPIDLPTFSPPDWFLEIRRNGRIAVSHRQPLYAPTAGLILDLFAVLRANPAAVAINLGVPTTAIIRFLEEEPAFWAAANRIRKEEGMEGMNRHGRR
jgi:RF-1 domain